MARPGHGFLVFSSRKLCGMVAKYPYSERRRKLLIAVDERYLASELRWTLERENFRAEVHDAPSRIAHALSTDPPLALVLGASNEDFALDVRAILDAAAEPVPLVVVAEHVDSAMIRKLCATLRPDAWVVRPCSAAQLVSAILIASRESQGYRHLNESGVFAVDSAALDALYRIASELEGIGLVRRRSLGSESPMATFPGAEFLSARERQILDELVRRRRVTSIAEAFHLSEHTVRNHRKAIYAKLGVHSLDELVALVRGERDRAPISMGALR